VVFERPVACETTNSYSNRRAGEVNSPSGVRNSLTGLAIRGGRDKSALSGQGKPPAIITVVGVAKLVLLPSSLVDEEVGE